MLRTISFFISFILLLQFSCKQNCENVKVGDVELTSNASNFLVYKQGQEVSFKNQDGEIRTFTANINESVYFICQDITCRPLDPYKSDFCEYIEAPIIEMFLQSDSTLLGVEATVQAYEPESDLFYDPVRFTLSHVNDGLTASHIIAARFTDPPFKKSEIPDIENYTQYAGSIDVGSDILYDVLTFEKDGLAFYFKEYDGFVAFKIRDQVWLRQI